MTIVINGKKYTPYFTDKRVKIWYSNFYSEPLQRHFFIPVIIKLVCPVLDSFQKSLFGD